MRTCSQFLNIVKQAIPKYLKQYLEPVRITHSSIYYICVCYHQNLTLHKDKVNKFPLFDDDKPNDHNDHSQENKNQLVPSKLVTQEQQKQGKSLRRSTQPKY